MTVYYSCQDCNGASYSEAEYNKENNIEYTPPICKRCNDNGALSEEKLTPEEIASQIAERIKDDEARNKVDYK